MPLLFAYGTLCNEKVQNILFGRTLQSREFVLNGFTLRQCNDGFFTIKENHGSSVTGMIIELSDDDMIIADEWELVPLYERKRMQCESHDFWTYLRSDMSEIVDENANGYSAYPEEELLEIVREFMAERLNS